MRNYGFEVYFWGVDCGYEDLVDKLWIVILISIIYFFCVSGFVDRKMDYKGISLIVWDWWFYCYIENILLDLYLGEYLVE